MKFFGKKEDDIEDENLSDEELDRKVPTRKFKDLEPQNKRKRKEPAKPWGRTERILILSILLVTILLSIFFKISSLGFKFSFPQLHNIDFSSLNPLKDETITIGGDGQN